jgi:nitroimidazol reductase NimA-like FMN-containing flavoprotein (pyridoxamine 5'-phosphate oxidase superfamily)
MRLIDDHSGLEVLPLEECLARLGDTAIGRLVTSGGGAPEVFPVNFGFDGARVLFRTASGTKHADGQRGPVAFEIDGVDEGARSGWSVVVHGWLEELDGPAGTRAAEEMGVDPWADGAKPHVMRLTPTTITGRRVGAQVGASPAEGQRP